MLIKYKLKIMSAGVLAFSVVMPAQALIISLGTSSIIDNGAGDSNTAIGVIDFSLTGINGTSGTYNASGTVTEISNGTTSVTNSTSMTLTNLDIEATSGTVNDTIVFQSTNFPVLSLPSPGNIMLDGNWTSGASNTPTLVSGGDVRLSGYLSGDWQWGAYQGTNSEFFVPFNYTSSILSGAGASFGPVTGTPLIIPAANTDPFFGFNLDQADFTSVIGKLEFNLANSGDGLWLPGSADVSVGAVPVPASFWLFGSGLLGLLGITKRKKCA